MHIFISACAYERVQDTVTHGRRDIYRVRVLREAGQLLNLLAEHIIRDIKAPRTILKTNIHIPEPK